MNPKTRGTGRRRRNDWPVRLVPLWLVSLWRRCVGALMRLTATLAGITRSTRPLGWLQARKPSNSTSGDGSTILPSLT